MLEKYNIDKLIVFVNKMDLESKLIIPENIKDIVYGNTIDINGLEKLKERITEKRRKPEYVSCIYQLVLQERTDTYRG